MHKITVAGAGYGGLSLAVLLSQHNQVTLLDINPKRIAMLQKKKDFQSKKYRSICMEDPDYEIDFEQCKEMLQSALQQVFPVKSSFEV